jgi:UDP-N-acetylglucosamine--N-acetylmuramyl-(pentapeptide) pyrophosphoryl-undecaprenol N-acetylglucosamine transferase
VQKILITTGGTGGHVIPAKIIKEHLIDDNEIYYSTDVRGLKYLSSYIDESIILDTPKFNFNFYFPYKVIKLIYLVLKAALFLKKKKIDKVISIGGYMSLPVVISAKILRLSIFLIEPNLVLGRANKLFLNFADKIFCYSNKLFNFPKKHRHKIELIKPLVYKIFYNQEENQNTNDKFCFLISGGSQGAKIFDFIIRDVMSEISKNIPIKVIQQTSKENIDNLKNFYDANHIENIIFNFEENFIDLINISDLCITRSGATSLAEISFLKKPFIAIPLPTSKDNHQMRNAEFYEEKGCCWILDQKNLNQENLLNFINHILNDKSDLINKKTNLQKLNYENSWKYINQKLKRIINEN